MNNQSIETTQKAVEARRRNILHIARRRKQSGELSLIEAAAFMAGAALLALAVIKGSSYVMNLIRSSQFTSEAQMFHNGVLNATQNNADFSSETLQSLATNRAFDSAGPRLSSDKSTLTGLFSGQVTLSVATMTTSNDSLVMTYPVPAPVCAMSVAALATTFSMVEVGGTTVSGPTTTFNSGTAGTACAAAGATTSISLYTSRN